ncbi:tyrosine-type recombinase/integrase [Tichowtungia aerotolerans]|uniref:Tyrosine-type recombinase/integrase n=1 Tax=Tichowtungia aerotolerans TaxID=2697043 RepID=A0A6P1M2E3_9BACT|nr:site-specific integrase [Tichowtungia aerotolerans]QHI68760.1 tyrosine-type recombinase/integrase [Tichowtungia aerotolerans]
MATEAKKAEKKTRAARGTGRLYKRTKDGKEYPPTKKNPGVFWIQYTLNGKRIRRCLTGKDGKPITKLEEAEAERKRLTAPLRAGKQVEQLQALTAALTQAEGQQEQAAENAAPVLPIVKAWDAYLQSPDRPDSGTDTLIDYQGYWNAFARWLKENREDAQALRDISPEIAHDYAKSLSGNKTSPNTYNKHITFLKLLFRVLEKPACLAENPFAPIRRKKLKTNVRRELTIAELKEILSRATGDLQTLLYLGTFTGLRLGDCCTLKWGEIDLDRGLIRRVPNKIAHNENVKPVLIGIPAALYAKLSEAPQSRRKGYVLPRIAELYTSRGATGRPDKQPQLSREIQAHLTACNIQTLKEGTGKEAYKTALKKWETNGKKGTKPSRKRAVVEVGFHSLRHSYVTLHAEAGTPQAMIQANVGHANPAMTAHYTHVGEEAARRAAGALTLNALSAIPERTPLPPWAVEVAKKLNSKNWKQVRTALLNNSAH